MQNTDRTEDDRNSSSDNAGNGTEAAGDQPTDFSTEIMSVTEMEQSPDGSPDVTEETAQDSKIPNVADLTTDIEANFPPEYEKFWKAVVENPQDFTGWVYLLQYVEQENHLLAARKAFVNFFTHYPYCYGYWKKYADLEKRHSNIKQSDEYAKYMENHSIEGVRHVYSRACTIHLPKKPMVHVLWAAFEEQQGNINEARRILKTFEECVVGLAMVRLRRVSLERRHGNMEEAEHLLMEAVKNAKSRNELSFYTIKLAQHLFKVQKNLPKARTVLSEAIEKDKENTKLYLNLLEMEYSGDLKQNEENILSCFDKAVSGALSIKVRITFSQRKVEFLEDFGSDVSKLLDAYSEHQALLKEQDSLKRKAENGSEEPDEKKAHTDDATMASTQMMDGDMQANQMAYNYSAWYQYNYQNAWTYGQYYPPPPT